MCVLCDGSYRPACYVSNALLV
ncbi:hypothetical protein CO2235_U910019 [Cupriavidus oxalaticus]|uniref:Uncharacterized protein n=1 Tax=Cupriavidus oxalaticus TaxID=96344 RepID=A0A375FTD9_9BURK|nr:hypothetical protein CO2235_U910019 [Cupriavidus oxalaticus]